MAGVGLSAGCFIGAWGVCVLEVSGMRSPCGVCGEGGRLKGEREGEKRRRKKEGEAGSGAAGPGVSILKMHF